MWFWIVVAIVVVLVASGAASEGETPVWLQVIGLIALIWLVGLFLTAC